MDLDPGSQGSIRDGSQNNHPSKRKDVMMRLPTPSPEVRREMGTRQPIMSAYFAVWLRRCIISFGLPLWHLLSCTVVTNSLVCVHLLTVCWYVCPLLPARGYHCCHRCATQRLGQQRSWERENGIVLFPILPPQHSNPRISRRPRRHSAWWQPASQPRKSCCLPSTSVFRCSLL